MRIAIVHDWLVNRGGAENVLEAICEAFPGDCFSLFALKEWGAVHTSFLQKIPYIAKIYPFTLPLMPKAIESLNLSHYDLIISSSWAVAKGVKKLPHQLHICYCHTPMRYIWDLKESYLKAACWKRPFFNLCISPLQKWDAKSANRVDFWIANSTCVAGRIKTHYNASAHIIFPPVKTDQFLPSQQRGDYYITASRMVPYKRVDLIVKAFELLPHQKLIVIGSGPQLRFLRKICPPNVQLLGYRDDLASWVAGAKGFVFAAHEDFGIAPVEAQSCGVPVLAYRKGGALDTVIDGKTGLFFDSQTPEAIAAGVIAMEKHLFDAEEIRRHALNFGKARFQKELIHFVHACLDSRRRTGEPTLASVNTSPP